jgi:hypothetical protein
MVYADFTGVKFKESKFHKTLFEYNGGISKEMEIYLRSQGVDFDEDNYEEYAEEDEDYEVVELSLEDSKDIFNSFFK